MTDFYRKAAEMRKQLNKTAKKKKAPAEVTLKKHNKNTSILSVDKNQVAIPDVGYVERLEKKVNEMEDHLRIANQQIGILQGAIIELSRNQNNSPRERRFENDDD